MTIKEIAAKLGLSPSTISRALNHPEMVAIETRMRVEQAVRRHRYRPSTIARSLRVRQSQTIGLILADITNSFSAELARTVESVAKERGYTLILFNSDEEESLERQALEALLRWQVQGVILAPCGGNRALLKEILESGIALVQVDRCIEGLEADAVLVDNRGGARLAVEHLVSRGHRRVAHIAGAQQVTTGVERLDGYREAMTAAGLGPEFQMVEAGYFREEGGYQAARRLFEGRPADQRPTALFAGNNEMAAGAIRALDELKLRIPEDVSFVTFDDSRWGRLMRPPLTVIAQPVWELGRTSAELLLRRIEAGGRARMAATRYTLQVTLVVRDSTAPVNGVGALSAADGAHRVRRASQASRNQGIIR